MYGTRPPGWVRTVETSVHGIFPITRFPILLESFRFDYEYEYEFVIFVRQLLASSPVDVSRSHRLF